MNFEVNPPGLRRLKVWHVLVGVLIFYGVSDIVISFLMGRGRSEADKSMRELCFALTSGRLDRADVGADFDSHVLSDLKSDLKGMGAIKSASYKIVTCQISGTPCIVELDARSANASRKLEMYFEGRRCGGVHVMRR